MPFLNLVCPSLDGLNFALPPEQILDGADGAGVKRVGPHDGTVSDGDGYVITGESRSVPLSFTLEIGWVALDPRIMMMTHGYYCGLRRVAGGDVVRNAASPLHTRSSSTRPASRPDWFGRTCRRRSVARDLMTMLTGAHGKVPSNTGVHDDHASQARGMADFARKVLHYYRRFVVSKVVVDSDSH